MFNQQPKYHFVVIYKAPEKSFIVGHTIAVSKDEALDKLVPSYIPVLLKTKFFRARRNIIHRVYTTL